MTDNAAPAWKWRMVAESGEEKAVSCPQPDYGVAVSDAIKHGFRPSDDHWIVVTASGVMRFEPFEASTNRQGVQPAGPSRRWSDGKDTES